MIMRPLENTAANPYDVLDTAKAWNVSVENVLDKYLDEHIINSLEEEKILKEIQEIQDKVKKVN